MQAADLRKCIDATMVRRFDVSSSRRISIKRKVRAVLVVVGEVRGRDSDQMRLVEDNYMVQALASN